MLRFIVAKVGTHTSSAFLGRVVAAVLSTQGVRGWFAISLALTAPAYVCLVVTAVVSAFALRVIARWFFGRPSASAAPSAPSATPVLALGVGTRIGIARCEIVEWFP